MANSDGVRSSAIAWQSVLRLVGDGGGIPVAGHCGTLREISANTVINKSTALRLLTHLENERCFTRSSKGGYSLGARLLQSGARPVDPLFYQTGSCLTGTTDRPLPAER